MKPSNVLKVLKTGIPKQRTFLLTGGPGVGKTDLSKQGAELAEYNHRVFHPVWSDPTEARGMPWIFKEEGSEKPRAEFIPFGDLERLLKTEEPTVAILDDLGQAAPLVQASYMPWLLERRINGHTFPDHVTFIACTNRREDRAAVSGILEPVKSRFHTILNLDVDIEDWIKWAIQNNIHPVMQAFIRFRPELLFDFTPTGDMTNSPTPRTVANVARLYADKYPHETELELYQGAAGEGFAIEFLAFAKIYRKAVSPAKVIADPDSITIPEDPAVLYALCGAVANLSRTETMPQIIKFAERLAVGDNFSNKIARSEFAVLLVRDSCNHDEECRNTREYIEWQTQNSDIIV